MRASCTGCALGLVAILALWALLLVWGYAYLGDRWRLP